MRGGGILSHLDTALPASSGLSVADLLSGPATDFVRAPDPFERFAQEHAAHRALPSVDGPTLRVLTYNCALLDRPYLLCRVIMPEMARRRLVIWDRLLTDGWDVLLLQEVWDDSDLDALKSAGERHGFRVWGGTVSNHSLHGLAIAVRDSIVESGGDTRGEGLFQSRYRAEQWPGPNIRRGWISWRLRLRETGRPLHLWTTHMAPFLEFWRYRRAQARELGLRVRELSAEELVIVGGDTNAGPWYADNLWTRPDGKAVYQLWQDAVSYALLRHYGRLQDAAVLGGLGMAPGDGVTTTDGNCLYARSYLGTEPEARMDLILMRDDLGKTRVTNAALEYTERCDFGAAGRFELSDHYGVSVTFRTTKRPN